MKSKIVKFLFVLLLLITPIICSAQNTYAMWVKFLLVEESKIDLSRVSLLNPEYLNSPNIKKYLLERIKQFANLPPKTIAEIEQKFDSVEFFCLKKNFGQTILLRIWIPKNIEKSCIDEGTLYYLLIDYELPSGFRVILTFGPSEYYLLIDYELPSESRVLNINSSSASSSAAPTDFCADGSNAKT